MEILYLSIGSLGGIIFSWILFKSKQSKDSLSALKESTHNEQLYQQERHQLTMEITRLQERTEALLAEKQEQIKELGNLRQKNEILYRQATISDTQQKNMEEKLNTQKQEVELLQERFKTEFENLATRILKQNSQEFTSSNQKNINEILAPLKEKIHSFEQKVEQTYDKELRDKISLREEVKKLYELNVRISDEANNLTRALKGDVKKQGNWGEVVLERVLERSGLSRGQEYDREVVTINGDGKQIRPDVIIRLPQEKHIIIDSKVSLVAYERFINATTPEQKERSIKEHIISMKAHVKELADKHYQSAAELNTPDFVLLFVPIESSFAIAVQADQDLFSYAWDNKIVIVSPSTLLATLRTIASIWKQEYQNRNVLEIARQGGALYDKLVAFTEDLLKVGKRLEETQTTYQDSLKKLYQGKGNLVRRAENIRELGAKVKKHMPQPMVDQMQKHELLEE